MKPILDEHISWFIYENDKPIAMWINIPDLNQWFKYLNGKFGWLEKLKFLLAKFFIKIRKWLAWFSELFQNGKGKASMDL